jgi:hypothetical protein
MKDMLLYIVTFSHKYGVDVFPVLVTRGVDVYTCSAVTRELARRRYNSKDPNDVVEVEGPWAEEDIITVGDHA